MCVSMPDCTMFLCSVCLDGRVLYVRSAEAMPSVGLIVFDRSNNSNKLGIAVN